MSTLDEMMDMLAQSDGTDGVLNYRIMCAIHAEIGRINARLERLEPTIEPGDFDDEEAA